MKETHNIIYTHPSIMNYAPYIKKHVSYIKSKLPEKIDNSIYITLYKYFLNVDYKHVQLSLSNITKYNVLTFFQEEYSMSKVIIEDMNANFNLSLNDNAMADIAIIIAAARHHVSPLHILKIMEQINEMIKLIKYHFMFKLDHKSISGRRLIEHLKYLSIRILKKQKDVSNIDEWFPEARKKYQLPYKCAENIAQFLKQKYEFDLTGTEIIFLTIHIQSLIYETE